MRKLWFWLLLALGAFFGLVWWFDVEQAGGSFADFFSDPVTGTQSLISRLGLIVSGWFTQVGGAVGGTVNATALAASTIAQFEGFSAKAYPDPPGQTNTYSIGYGHQLVPGDGFNTSSTISESDALALLQADLSTFAECVDTAVTVDLTPQQRAALYSLCYNIGCAAFQNSTLLGDLNTGDYAQAQEQFAVWNKAGGEISDALVSRRAQEASLFGSTGPLTDASDAASADQVASDSGETEDTGA